MTHEISLHTFYRHAFAFGHYDRLEGGTGVFTVTASDRFRFPQLSQAKEIRVTLSFNSRTRIEIVNRVNVPVVGQATWDVGREGTRDRGWRIK